MSADARRCLNQDPAMRRVLDVLPAPDFDPPDFSELFTPLTRSIVFQQLSGKAATTIYGRVAEQFGDGNRPTSTAVVKASIDDLRAAGLSRQKSTYIQGIAQAQESGQLPDRAIAEDMSDEQLIQALTALKGVGRWTVEMFLMFWLGRPDILPTNDLGIQKGIRVIDRLTDLPSPRQVAERGEVWKPFRSTASWYLWRASEMDTASIT